MKDRLRILDIWVDPLTRTEAIQRVHDFLKYGHRPHVIFAANPEKNFSVPRDPELYQAFKQADLILPDGIGIVLATRLLYGLRQEQIPGAEFMEDILRLAAREGYQVFFYGAREEVNRQAVSILQHRFIGLTVAGRAHGYLAPAAMPDLVKQINESGAAILFISLGSPKQEKWYAAHKEALTHVKVVQGIGGTLDTIVGTVLRAPESWRRAHLEWLYRLLREPRRFRRQKVLPVFAFKVFREKLKRLSGGKNSMD